ncbi:hypothetical protein TWF694_002760 [Orbilia ellipsospora]|uniref:J domain-containing protein n=1 Tax=Orbilia ellipsospora TaxID=2528407 RepID=A0AAV9X0M5_9PEZI
MSLCSTHMRLSNQAKLIAIRWTGLPANNILYQAQAYSFFRYRSIHYSFQYKFGRAGYDKGGKTLYDILGLPRHAQQLDIKAKFYELSKLHHPDRNQGDASANDRFVEISNAYRILSNSLTKASYDNSLKDYQMSATNLQNKRGPVGGREAAGLSRRRVNPQGPPPSYYRDHGFQAKSEDKTPRSTQSNTLHFNWDEKYRQHYAYQQRFKRGTFAASDGPKRQRSSNFIDFFFRAAAVGSCLLLAGTLGGWFISTEQQLGSRRN